MSIKSLALFATSNLLSIKLLLNTDFAEDNLVRRWC